jgi:uncharacterized protein YabE (DUF348 family)
MVSLYADGQKRVFSTDAPTVGELLERSNVKLGSGDIVEPAASTVMSNGFFNINVYRARPVIVVDGYRSYRFNSASRSPRIMAEQAGLTVYPEDTYRQEAVRDIVSSQAIGDKVSVMRSIPLSVRVDGVVREVRTQDATVGDAIKHAGIALGLNDTVTIPQNTAVEPGLAFGIIRVTEVVTTITNSIAKTVQETTDPSLPKGQTVVKSEGSDGSRTASFRISYKDGVETGRQMVALVSMLDPTPKVTVKGTKELFSGSVEYWRPIVIAAAAEWNYDPNTMMRIMACESRGNASSISGFVVNGQHPMGLFQYLPSTWRAAGGTDANILDGEAQIKITARKMALYGTGPWECR